MFDDLLKELKKLESIEVSIPVETDEDGYFDKECPNDDCLSQFKIHEDSWNTLEKTDTVYCPFCRTDASADSFWTTEQIEKSKDEAFKQAKYEVMRAFEKGSKSFNRKSSRSKSLISFKLKVDRSTKPILVPLESYLEMQQKVVCDNCNSKYAFIGIAYFCPICGESSFEKLFSSSLEKVRIKLKQIDNISSVIEDNDEAKIISNSIVESCLIDGAMALQKYCFEYFKKSKISGNYSLNDFQILDKGNKLWKQHFNICYEDILTEFELKTLNIYLQQRHLLAHAGGIVDEKYLLKSNDARYKVGQRIIIRDKNVMEFIDLIQRLVEGFRVIDK